MNTKDINDVSVCILTYNHVNTIKQCLDSVLSQQFLGSYNVIIADDSSTDGTIQIINNYKNKYNQIITILPYEKHIGMGKNLKRLLESSNSIYTMICEGDDWWHKNKLQKQYDFMINHVEYSICYTDFDEYWEQDNSIHKNILKKHNINFSEINFKDQLLRMDFWFATASICCKTKLLKNSLYEDIIWNNDLALYDIVIRLGLAKRGIAGIILESLCTYRINQKGKSASRLKDVIKIKKLILDDLSIREYFACNSVSEEEWCQVMYHYIKMLIPILSLKYDSDLFNQINEWINKYNYIKNRKEKILLFLSSSKYLVLILNIYRKIKNS